MTDGKIMHIVLLLGSSTAGKSALCKQLVTEHQWHSNSFDEVGARATLEHLAVVKPFIFEELHKHHLTDKLQVLMTDNDIQNLASMGRLTISQGDHKLSCSFSSAELEGLEEKLKGAGFNENEISELAKNFRLTTKIGQDIYKAHPFPDPMKRICEETFTPDNNGKSIVLDVVPDQNSTAEAGIEYFKKRAQQYQIQNPNTPVEISIVFAYCPPKKLSERITERNRQAEINDPMDKREGLFPFEQLATLVTADSKFDETSSQTLSRTELFSFVQRHANTEKPGASVFLENPVDPEAIQASHSNLQTSILKGDAVKIHPSSDVDQPQILQSARIGSKKTIKEYVGLANRFGMFQNQEQASLNITAGLSFDAIIDTSKGTPDVLAKDFLEQLHKNKATSHHISKL
jgi:hypothetical protein